MATTHAFRAEPATPACAPSADRRYELDWLRAFVVLGLIPFHTAVIFSATSDVFVKNGQTNALMSTLTAFAGIWGMPLLFVVAGAGSYFALNQRPPARYLWERVQRLVVPFVFATLTLIPILVYAVMSGAPNLIHNFDIPIHDPNFASSPLAFYIEYLRDYGYFLTHFSLNLAIIFWGYLWFIPRLFVYALLTLPALLWLRSARGKRLLTGLGRLIRYPGAALFFALPIAIALMVVNGAGLNALTAGWPIYDDWEQFFYFLLYFLYGYLLFAISTMPEAIVRHGWVALALGVAGFALALWMSRGVALATDPPDGAMDMVNALIRGSVSWFWVVAIFSFAFHRLTFTNRLLVYLNEAAFPIYVLHMPIVAILGMYIIAFDIPLALKFVLIIAVALALTVGLYEFLVRRFRITRALFGMKPRQGRADSTAPQPPGISPGVRVTLLTGGERYAQ